MQKPKHTKKLLLQLMTQADRDFMNLDFDHMTEEEFNRHFDDWSRLILFYENLYQPFKPQQQCHNSMK